MIILKKKHEEIVKQEYKKGFEAGAVSATDVLEEEFKDKLYNLNLSNNEISNENIELHSKILNLNKIINASVDQVNDIKLIQNLKKFDELPDYLKEIAIVRLENPDASLKSLGEMLENPIGKSGVNHRLNKIHEIAEELRQRK